MTKRMTRLRHAQTRGFTGSRGGCCKCVSRSCHIGRRGIRSKAQCGRHRLWRPGTVHERPRSRTELVALAEPDAGNLDRALKRLEAGAEGRVKGFDPARIKTFSDYRAMYDKIHKEIDLVLIATPDHQHACPSMMAIKLGKHVYCEKPLVHHIAEARALGEAARQSQVVTQMGNQGSGTGGHQAVAEWLAAGAIGKLREVHAWHVFASRFGGSMPKPEPRAGPRRAGLGRLARSSPRAAVQFRLPAVARLVRLRHRLAGRLGNARDGCRVLCLEVGLSADVWSCST